VLLTRCTDGSFNAAKLQKFRGMEPGAAISVIARKQIYGYCQGWLPRITEGGKGTNMTVDKGNKLARAGLDNGSGEKLATDPKLDSGSQKRIGDQLRAMYDELMQQPVPDRFRDLLDQLDKNGQKGGSQ
jgi:hypothetical protein